jgi:hypothetical protein
LEREHAVALKARAVAVDQLGNRRTTTTTLMLRAR